MCVSLRPARFSKTKGLAAEAKLGRKIVHLLGYQNNVANGASAPSFRQGRRSGSSSFRQPTPMTTGSGNAMLLPIPAKSGTMTEKNIVDTTTCPNILKDMERALRPATLGGLRRGRGPVAKGLPDSVQVFDHDIYTVVLATNAEDIPAALSRVRADRRPALNDAIFKAYAQWYPGWTFALCCFNVADEAQAKPLLWWYEPQRKDLLFFPAVDAHDGNVPDLTAEVDVDHVIAFGSHRSDAGTDVDYTDAGIKADVRKLLPSRVIGRSYYNESLQQGDFVVSVDDVRSGRLSIRRELPPGAPATGARR